MTRPADRTAASAAQDVFVQHVHDALTRLHDPPSLESHPLAARAATQPGRAETAGQSLRRALFDALDSLRPATRDPADPRAGRGHRLLTLRYADGASILTVRGALSIGRSEYFREHARAVAAVAALLARRWDVSSPPTAPTPPSPPRAEPSFAAGSHLPKPLTSFVGRERELAQLAALAGRSRLVTLIGAGGVGKTRLAIRVAEQLADAFPDGTRFVDLAPVGVPGLVAAAAAAPFELREAPGTPIATSLGEHLRDKAVLLLLDNCEHLLQASAELAEMLLRSAPRLVVLATSREPLGAAGEVLWRVPSLSLPHNGDTRDSEAVRLFVERARLVEPAFVLTDHNAAHATSICTHLDGIPLAIELAAARLRALPLGGIATRLDDRFRLLTGGGRTAVPRQQTLRATLDWSHDLLRPDEKVLLRRLSVFVGPFDLEAAAAICADEAAEPYAVLDLLTSLVDKSLAVPEPPAELMGFRLLETIRQYAGEKLLDAGEAAELRHRHAAHYLDLALRAEPHLFGPGQPEWLGRLDRDQDNLRAALEWWLDDPNGAEPAARLATALWRLWHIRARHDEGSTWYERVLAHPAELPPPVRPRMLAAAAHLAMWGGRPARGRELAEQALAVARALDDPAATGLALIMLGICALSLDDVAASRAALEAAVVAAETTRDDWMLALAVGSLARLAGQVGDDAGAMALHERSLAIRRRVGDPHDIAQSLYLIGSATERRGDTALARSRLEEALAISRQGGYRFVTMYCLNQLAGIARRTGDFGGATTMVEEALGLARHGGEHNIVGAALAGLGRVAAARSEVERAAELYREALAVRRETGEVHSVLEVLDHLAGLAHQRRRAPRATTVLGAVDALRAQLSAPRAPVERPEYERVLAAARADLSRDDFDAAWRRGQEMTLDEAIATALGDEAD